MALDKNLETFVFHILVVKRITIYLFQVAQIAVLQWNKAPTKISAEYFDYTDVFSRDLAIKLPENIGINKHTIKLIEGKQSSYEPIYTQNLVELETLKTYIETHLKTGFIKSSKFSVGAFILFDKSLMVACICM